MRAGQAITRKPSSLKKERTDLIRSLRAEGKTWVAIAADFRRRYGANGRTALRLAHGWSQRRAAEEWSRRWPDDIKTAKNFSYWESWPFSGHAPSLAVLDKLAQLYECKVTDLLTDLHDYAPDSDPNAEPGSLVVVGQPNGGFDDQGEAIGALDEVRILWDSMMRRRAFFTGAGAAATSVMLCPGLLGSGQNLPAITEALDANAALVRDYWKIEGLLGPGAVYSQASEHHRMLLRWHRQSENESERQALGRVLADSGILMGWLHFDMEQFDQASTVYRSTLDVADELDDVNLRAFIIGRMSRTLSECKEHGEALQFAELGQRLAGDSALPEVRSWLLATRAYVHASLGDERSSRADLDAAEAVLATASKERLPDYIDFYGKPNLYKWAGHSLLRLAECSSASPREGRAAIDRALAIWPPHGVRESAEVLTAYASARLAEREVEEAARTTMRAYDIGARTASPRILHYVSDLRERMAPFRQTRAVRDLDEHLLATSAG